MSSAREEQTQIVIIGGGPAGLIAAERLAQAGVSVTLFEQKPSVGRKFLMAGRGGLNLTHSEPFDAFIARYREAALFLQTMIEAFPPTALRAWCEGLGQPTFVGSSGRVFPESFKASPLLRAWLVRLESMGVRIRTNCRWAGWRDGALIFATPDGEDQVRAGATLLALGGASWPKLGSDGAWTSLLRAQGVPVTPFRPANCGFTVPWTPRFAERFAGQPLKPVALSFEGQTVRGEMILTQRGVEGGAVYALAAPLRDAIGRDGHADLLIDLKPGLDETQTARKLAAPAGRQSLANHLRRTLNLPPQAIGLLRETIDPALLTSPHAGFLARSVKAVRLRLTATAPLDRAISSAGGIALDALDDRLMLKALPGVFAAGEMLDWEAPTGGYLLQADFATGVAAADGILRWLA